MDADLLFLRGMGNLYFAVLFFFRFRRSVEGMYDAVIIGAGVSGSAAARELSRFRGNFCVLEKEEDVCCGTSKANSAIVHAGFDAPEGSLMAELNVEGNRMMGELSEELDFPFQRIGSLVICTDEHDRGKLQELLERGRANGVPDLRIVEREELRKMEPNVSDDAVAALYAPTGGIVCPFLLNITMAENAAVNGVEFRFNTKVNGIEKTEKGFCLHTNNGEVSARTVVNAAGVYADVIHGMVSREKIHITLTFWIKAPESMFLIRSSRFRQKWEKEFWSLLRFMEIFWSARQQWISRTRKA